MKMNEKRREFLEALSEAGYGPGSVISRAAALGVHGDMPTGTKVPWWFISDRYRTPNPSGRGVVRGMFTVPDPNEGGEPWRGERIPASAAPAKESNPASSSEVAMFESSADSAVPRVFDDYVPFGYYNDVVKILETEAFFPIFISGLSGNGKTFMTEQACARAGRELFRVNITIETDEDDLIGGIGIEDGSTKWFDGPAIEAMRRGAVLLLDEIDLGSNKLLCLQPILEGSPILLKKTKEIVYPAPGFTIVATANTKGKGCDSGMFVGTNVMNEAMLERFNITIEQEYPPVSVEHKIVNNAMEKVGASDPEFAEHLVRWASDIRKSYFEDADGIDEIISTRRLVHISKTYGIFKDREKAIKLCLNRFDDETKETFMRFYSLIDEAIEKEKAEKARKKAEKERAAAIKNGEVVPPDPETAAPNEGRIPF